MDKLLQLHISLLLASLLYFPSIFYSEISSPDQHALSKCHALGVIVQDVTSNSVVVENLAFVNMANSPVSLEWGTLVANCQPGGEHISFTATLTTTINIPADNFTIKIIQDENGNGQPELGEPILFQQTYFGSVSPTFPLNVSGMFNAPASQLCNLVATLETIISNVCDTVELALPAPSLANAGADQFFCNIAGASLNTTLGIPDCGNSDYIYSWTALPPANITDMDDPYLAQPTLNLDWVNLVGETLTYVLETHRIGCSQPTFDTIQLTLPNDAFGFFINDTLQLQALNCQSNVEYCLGIAESSIANFEVMLNGAVYPNANFTICNGNEVAVQAPVGFNVLTMTDLINGCSDTIALDIFCAVTETIDLSILLHESDTLCFDGNELTGPLKSVTNLCPDGSFVNYEVFADSCIIFTAALVGMESACFVACDANGFCDTTFVNITVQHPFPNGLSDTLIVSQMSEYCFDENLVSIIGAIDVFENICPDTSGASINFSLDPINNCIVYEAIAIGSDTACVEICDNLGNCDTINYSVTVVPGYSVFDTVFIFVVTKTYCVDENLLPGNIVSVVDICPGNNSEHVVFEINGKCISYFGESLGEDYACLRIEDEFGNVAIINLVVTVVKTTPEVFCDTIFIGQNKEFCIDTTELPGLYQNLKILYDDNISESVFFEENTEEICIRYEGLSLGKDSFAVAVCDHYGFCDTTSFCITVAPYFELPVLQEDFDTTLQETQIVLDPLSNDTLYGGLRDYYILIPPISGSATINLDGSVSYIPAPAICSRSDIFTYVACNPNGCDTTVVNVYIDCVNLTIFNAVSPNNDNVNDYFYIGKIENFPNNRLWVYNRWGNQVFDSGVDGYHNNWPGTWGDDIDLPDGTYYFILEWKDNDITRVQRGYFEMFR